MMVKKGETKDEKGELIFQEAWAYEHEYKDRSNVIIMPILVPIGFFFMIIETLGAFNYYSSPEFRDEIGF